MIESPDSKSSTGTPTFATDANIQSGPKKLSFVTRVVKGEEECEKAPPQFTHKERVSKKSSKDYIHISKEA
jgi:hypothetical protein